MHILSPETDNCPNNDKTQWYNGTTDIQREAAIEGPPWNGKQHNLVGRGLKPILLHYENKPIQIYWKFYHPKNENFQLKIFDIFHISAQNIDCGYSLEPPRRGGSSEYPQSFFFEQK